MYFTTFNHYDDDDNNDYFSYNHIYNDEQCLICWETSTTNNNIYKMQSLLIPSIYYTNCSCNAYFHNECLLKWVYKTHSCPICRTNFVFNINEKLPLTFSIFKIFKLCISIIFIRILYDVIFNIHFVVEKKIHDQQYDPL
jgi:hypothetical protein